MVNIEVCAGICGFTTRIEAEKKEGYSAVFRLDSQCGNWMKINDILGDKELDVMAELFKSTTSGKVESQVIETSLASIPHVSCPVISGILKALEVSVGLALPKDATITFQKEKP